MAKGNGKLIQRVRIELAITPSQRTELIGVLKARFDQNMHRHEGLEWENVLRRLGSIEERLSSLYAMERTGGEPDVIDHDLETGEFVFCDCSEQTPAGRRSICYDREGEEARIRKGVTPGGNAVGLAAAMRIEFLDEHQYFELQRLGEFDTKTQSWLKTPKEIRELGGAIFGDRRYGRVFVGHNSAPSFYSVRGFRGLVRA